MKPLLREFLSRESTVSRMAIIIISPRPHPWQVIALSFADRAVAGPFCGRRKANGELSPAGPGPRPQRPFPPRGWGQPSCLQLPQSFTVNDLPGSLSKINKNVLKFNLKNLASIIHIEYFSSSKGPVWEFRPPPPRPEKGL